jgi:hypothetical protein
MVVNVITNCVKVEGTKYEDKLNSSFKELMFINKEDVLCLLLVVLD